MGGMRFPPARGKACICGATDAWPGAWPQRGRPARPQRAWVVCQGSLREITAVPEIVAQCDEAAQSLLALAPSAHREVALSA